MKREIKLTGKQLADVLSISPQAVGGLEKRGRLIRDEVGLYDLKNPENKKYIEGRGIVISKIAITPPMPAGRPTTPRSQGTIKKPSSGSDKSLSELNKELTQKRIEKLDLERNIKLKKYLPTEFIENFLIRYIEALHSNIERSAGATIRDYAKEILNAGELTPDMINRWINVFLNLCHSTKIQMLKEIENYDPNTGGAK